VLTVCQRNGPIKISEEDDFGVCFHVRKFGGTHGDNRYLVLEHDGALSTESSYGKLSDADDVNGDPLKREAYRIMPQIGR
jgi:hypothetical protein